MINPNMLDRDLEDSDSVSNSSVLSTTIENSLLPNEQFMKYVFNWMTVDSVCSIL